MESPLRSLHDHPSRGGNAFISSYRKGRDTGQDEQTEREERKKVMEMR